MYDASGSIVVSQLPGRSWAQVTACMEFCMFSQCPCGVTLGSLVSYQIPLAKLPLVVTVWIFVYGDLWLTRILGWLGCIPTLFIGYIPLPSPNPFNLCLSHCRGPLEEMCKKTNSTSWNSTQTSLVTQLIQKRAFGIVSKWLLIKII